MKLLLSITENRPSSNNTNVHNMKRKYNMICVCKSIASYASLGNLDFIEQKTPDAKETGETLQSQTQSRSPKWQDNLLQCFKTIKYDLFEKKKKKKEKE